ncbi:hypothetical protein M595_2708 [Lyngbya aestuarii BL J]|uniref:Uncharacterized protein n=1 Tax=Lyngbya aestuarii BL J TaxID=1348334 RepID=U7QJM6_9CYAN|nr:hypothetical protein M595_2708 [Lyngbya aestuarii BL J]
MVFNDPIPDHFITQTPLALAGLFHSQLKIAGVDGESTPVRGNKRVEGSGYPVGGERVKG